MAQPRIVLYGPSKIGISHFCSKIPNAYFMDVSGSLDHLHTQGERCISMDQCEKLVSKLMQGNHLHKVLVIDSLYGLENLIMNEVFNYEEEKRTPGIKYFEEIPWGRGPSMVIDEFKKFLLTLDQLRLERKMSIIIAAQEIVSERHSSFLTPISHSRPWMVSKATKTQMIVEDAVTVLSSWADCTLYVSQRNHVRGQYYGKKNFDSINQDPQDKCIYTDSRPSFEAGNRYGLPYELPMDWENLYNKIENYFINNSKVLPVNELEDFEVENINEVPFE